MSDSQRSRGLGAAARVTALASSVMDLHVRIALQEMDREKRRLISGGIFLVLGGFLLIFSLLAMEICLLVWMQNSFAISFQWGLVFIALLDLTIGGISIRIGGKLTQGPYLPETVEGIAKTGKAVFGKN